LILHDTPVGALQLCLSGTSARLKVNFGRFHPAFMRGGVGVTGLKFQRKVSIISYVGDYVAQKK
jgi:hypothetical protein